MIAFQYKLEILLFSTEKICVVYVNNVSICIDHSSFINIWLICFKRLLIGWKLLLLDTKAVGHYKYRVVQTKTRESNSNILN